MPSDGMLSISTTSTVQYGGSWNKVLVQYCSPLWRTGHGDYDLPLDALMRDWERVVGTQGTGSQGSHPLCTSLRQRS